ncbi:hypothetical protein ABEB36_004688 [Hypothenemus hampei]|uniref:Uncharacterized protein n=1 Tax=Hypothenemus hampei TaxID=57062 RepID=A0ABD1F460_HYPHA
MERSSALGGVAHQNDAIVRNATTEVDLEVEFKNPKLLTQTQMHSRAEVRSTKDSFSFLHERTNRHEKAAGFSRKTQNLVSKATGHQLQIDLADYPTKGEFVSALKKLDKMSGAALLLALLPIQIIRETEPAAGRLCS